MASIIWNNLKGLKDKTEAFFGGAFCFALDWKFWRYHETQKDAIKALLNFAEKLNLNLLFIIILWTCFFGNYYDDGFHDFSWVSRSMDFHHNELWNFNPWAYTRPNLTTLIHIFKDTLIFDWVFDSFPFFEACILFTDEYSYSIKRLLVLFLWKSFLWPIQTGLYVIFRI